MLDPKVAKMVSKELEAESIIVFDEAHNIDSVCIEALSVTINERGLEQATRSLGRLSSEVTRIKASDSQRLQTEYQNLVNGLIDQGLLDQPTNDIGLASVSCGSRYCFSFLDIVLYISIMYLPLLQYRMYLVQMY
jgi:DNA excision repair protein ERCC-2